MEWYEIVYTVLGIILTSGGFIIVLYKLLMNKLIVKIDNIAEMVGSQGKTIKYNDGRLNAIFRAIDKTIGNGFTGRYHEFLQEETNRQQTER